MPQGMKRGMKPPQQIAELPPLLPLPGLPRPTLMLVMLLLFAAWLAMTPHVRFPILTDLRFERILLFGMFVGWLVAPARSAPPDHSISIRLALLFLAMLGSYLLSDFQQSYLVRAWIENYWKELVFFFFFAYGIRSREHLALFILGYAAISLLYQLHSWQDFLRGGSYVYQQGMVRMIGIWSAGGLGAANGWGAFALQSLPLGLFWWKVAWNPLQRAAAAALLAVSAASILFSGTRAAFVCGAVFGLYLVRSYVLKPMRLLLLVAVTALVWMQLPQAYRDRATLLFQTQSEVAQSGSEEVAVRSASARIKGLEDGWQLFLRQPVLGNGPGSSRDARAPLNPEIPREDLEQLHNLYGQVLAETGLVGAVAFVALLLAVYSATRRGSPQVNAESQLLPDQQLALLQATFLRQWMALLLMYGFFSHNLYHDNWIILAGLAAAFAGIGNTVVGRRQDLPGTHRV